MGKFGLPALVDHNSIKPMHSKAVPKAGAYERVRQQAYWMSLHVWLLHAKQHRLQVSEGLVGSALCGLITRRIHEWTWNQLRGLMADEDVPVMSLTGEVQD